MAQSQSKSPLQELKESGRQLVETTGKKLREAKKFVVEKAIPAAEKAVDTVLPSRDRRMWALGYEDEATPEETAQFEKADKENDEQTKGMLKDKVWRRKLERQKSKKQDAVQPADQSE